MKIKALAFKLLPFVVILTLLIPATGNASSHTEPTFQSETNKLEAVCNVLQSIYKRIEEILENSSKQKTPNPKGTRGKLLAISNELQVLNGRVEDVLSALPQERASLLHLVEEAVEKVSEDAVHIADLTRLGFEDPPDDLGVLLALDEVGASATQIFGIVRGYLRVLWDKVIPVRFVLVENCFPWGKACNPHVGWDSILASVHRLNEAFSPTDLHFSVKSVERYYLYHFAHETFPADSTVDSSDARDELGQVFPIYGYVPPSDWTALRWVEYMSTVFSDPYELLVWVFGHDSVVSRQMGHKSFASFPDGGRYVIISARNIYDPYRPTNENQPVLSPYHLTHEVGHFFGLPHTWNQPGGKHPEENRQVDWADLWDLCFCWGDLGFPVFFSSREDALSEDCLLQSIECPDPPNCLINNRQGLDDSDMEATLGYNTYHSGDSALKGLSFDLGTPENPPADLIGLYPYSFAWGLNAMGYWSRYNAHIWTPGRFSASQLDLIRGHAYNSVPIVADYSPYDVWSQRDLLGN